MTKDPNSMNPTLSACAAEGKHACEIAAQLASQLGHQRPECITHAYIGTFRAPSLLPRRSDGEASSRNV